MQNSPTHLYFRPWSPQMMPHTETLFSFEEDKKINKTDLTRSLLCNPLSGSQACLHAIYSVIWLLSAFLSSLVSSHSPALLLQNHQIPHCLILL